MSQSWDTSDALIRKKLLFRYLFEKVFGAVIFEEANCNPLTIFKSASKVPEFSAECSLMAKSKSLFQSYLSASKCTNMLGTSHRYALCFVDLQLPLLPDTV